jgi:hypothetical protein
MRTLRAVYNYAKLKVDRALPQTDMTMLVEWNAEKYGAGPVGRAAASLPPWRTRCGAKFHLFCLLSGPDMRRCRWPSGLTYSSPRRVLHIPALHLSCS